MDRDTIRRGGAVGSAVGGGSTLTGDRGGEVPDIRYGDVVAAGARLAASPKEAAAAADVLGKDQRWLV